MLLTPIPLPSQLPLSCHPWLVAYVGINSVNKYLLTHCFTSECDMEKCLRGKTHGGETQTEEGGKRRGGKGSECYWEWCFLLKCPKSSQW